MQSCSLTRMLIFDINAISCLLPLLKENTLLSHNEVFFSQNGKLHKVYQFVEHTTTILEDLGVFNDQVTGYTMVLDSFQELKLNGTELVVMSNTVVG